MMHVSKYQLHFCACGGCKDQLQTDRVFFRTSDAALNTCAGGDFTLEWNAMNAGDMELMVYDVNGRSVHKETVSQVHGDNVLSVKMSQLPSGVYIGRIFTAQESFSFKWIKQ